MLYFDNSANFARLGRQRYDAWVLGNVVRRAVEFAVLFFAAYAFVFVPLGSRTGLEHCLAILHTRAAREAGRDVATAAARLKRRVLGFGDEAVTGGGVPVVPALPKHRHEPTQAALAPARDFAPPDASM